MLDLKPDTEERFRVRSKIFEDPQHTHIYIYIYIYIYNVLIEQKNHLRGNYLPILIVLHCSYKAQKKELIKYLKPDTIKAIGECVINIIKKNIKVSD